jgi:non-canonical purine NTP pyrophosphatase (RdgB/HAM1 family)
MLQYLPVAQKGYSMSETPVIYFVTSNENKYREIRGALEDCPVTVERVALEVSEIQTLDPVEVAAYKARRAYEHIQTGHVLVEDTGLAIAAWKGYPGALIKWVLWAVGEAGLCNQLNAWSDRSAVATVVLCLFDGRETHMFVGEAEGKITHFPRGEHGFGWDSIFQPKDSPLTYGEMPREEKMKISMRARALEGLRQHLLSR